MIRLIVRATALAATLLFAVACALPVAAYNELGTTGVVGAHSLADTRSSPGARCRYRFSGSPTGLFLRRIVIGAPRVRAAQGHGTQRVGWSFSIDRRINYLSEHPWTAWEHRYTSPVMKATTDSGHDASFSSMGVRTLGTHHSNPDARFYYRATVKVFWYANDGSVAGTARMRVEWFKALAGDETYKLHWNCPGDT